MKTLPTIVASRDGRLRVEVLSFDGRQRVSNRDAVAFYFTIGLQPKGETTRVGVIFSGTVMVIGPDAFGLPDEGDRDTNLVNFSLAAIGDYLDEEGLPPVVRPGQPAHHIECFSPHFQAWMDRPPASDDDVEAYLQVHAYAAWEYGHDHWQVGPSDVVRLSLSMKSIDRLVALGEGEDWTVTERRGGYVSITPMPDFIRRKRKGPVSPAARTVEPDEKREAELEQPDAEAPRFVYVDETRLAELRQLPGANFDLRKLISLCEELNLCYRSQCYHAVAALNRAVIDHVPPILGVKSFAEVANNYAGSRSFKECMQRLEGAARKIADGHLHTPVRSKESLPTRTQVNFSNEIDVLLAEVVRILS